MRGILATLVVSVLLAVSGAPDPAPDPGGDPAKANGGPEAYTWGTEGVDMALVARQAALIPVAERLQSAVAGLDGFTGVAFDGDTLLLRWSGPLPAQAQAAVTAARANATVRTADARYSRSALLAGAARVRGDVEAGRGGGVHAIRIAGDGSGLIVSVDPAGPPVSASALSARAGLDASVVVEPRSRNYSRENDFPPWAGGAIMVNRESTSPYNGRSCTTGFGVRTSSGTTYVLTASHCGTNIDLFRDPTGEAIGRVAARDHDRDVMLVRASAAGEIYVGGPPGTAQGIKGVAGWSTPFVGQGMCQSGAATGNICGLLIEDVDDVRCAQDPEGTFIGGTPIKCWEVVRARRTNGALAGRPGDSGGPVYVPNGTRATALGVVTGGDGGAVLWFGTFRAANLDWGISALTRSF